MENQRYAAGKTLLEVPAGTIDPGESPDRTAERELVEETGYRAGRITFVRDWFVSPGFLTEKMSSLPLRRPDAGPTALEPDEKLRPIVVRWDDAIAMALDGRIEDGKSISRY